MESHEPEARPQKERTQKRAQIAVACDRCRSRKTKCDGVRPTCTPCAGQKSDCHYVAEADATPIIAQKRRNDALQQQCGELLDLIQSLVSVTDGDALSLLNQLREGITIPSVNISAANMPRVHTWQRPRGSPAEPASRSSPVASETESQGQRTLSPVSFGPPVKSRMVFEPRIDVVPVPPKFPSQWK